MQMEIKLSELSEIKGIGKKTINRVKQYVKGKEEIKEKRNTSLKVDKLQTNAIHCGDNIKVMREKMPDNSIDLTVTSPPYDNLRDYEGEWDFNFKELAKELYRVTKDSGVVVWVVADQTKNFCETLSSFKQAVYFVEEAGFNLLDTMIYKKRSYPPAYPNLNRYANQFEYMFVFSKGKPGNFNKLKEPKQASSIVDSKKSSYRKTDGSMFKTTIDASNEMKTKTNVWEFDVGYNKSSKDNFSHEHPATFPEQLAEDHIKSWSNEGDVVFDPMCGSGTTLKMAKKLNRKYIGIDISQKYCDISKDRLAGDE